MQWYLNVLFSSSSSSSVRWSQSFSFRRKQSICHVSIHIIFFFRDINNYLALEIFFLLACDWCTCVCVCTCSFLSSSSLDVLSIFTTVFSFPYLWRNHYCQIKSYTCVCVFLSFFAIKEEKNFKTILFSVHEIISLTFALHWYSSSDVSLPFVFNHKQIFLSNTFRSCQTILEICFAWWTSRVFSTSNFLFLRQSNDRCMFSTSFLTRLFDIDCIGPS